MVKTSSNYRPFEIHIYIYICFQDPWKNEVMKVIKPEFPRHSCRWSASDQRSAQAHSTCASIARCRLYFPEDGPRVWWDLFMKGMDTSIYWPVAKNLWTLAVPIFQTEARQRDQKTANDALLRFKKQQQLWKIILLHPNWLNLRTTKHLELFFLHVWTV